MAEIISLCNHRFFDVIVINGVVVDIGAHIGDFAKAVSDKYGCFVEAYEPTVENFNKIQQTDRGTAFNKAVSDYSGTADFYEYAGDGGCNGFIVRTDREPCLNSKDVVSIDSVLAKWDKVDLLVLNCEGAELPILLNSKELHRCKQITVEFHAHCGDKFDPPITGNDVDKCVEYLKSQGFNAMHTDKKRKPAHPDYLFHK